MVSLVSQQGCGRRAGGRSNGGKASLPSGLAIALLAACFTGSHAFDVHWNIVGSDAGEVAAQLTPKFNSCLRFDVEIVSEGFGKFFPPHVGSGFNASCGANYPCGIAAMFGLGGDAHDLFPDWEASMSSWLHQHEQKIHADVVAANMSTFAGIAIIDYENWFLTWDTKTQESFYAPFVQSFRAFVTSTNFPVFNTTMIARAGWSAPSGTQGWADLTPDEQENATAAIYDWAVRTFVESTLTAVHSEVPLASWGFFAYPWFRHPRPSRAMQLSNDKLSWLWEAVDVFAPAFYPEFWTTTDPSAAPCPMTNTPAQNAALYSANVIEALRLRSAYNPSARVLPYAGWYNLCGAVAPCSSDNIVDQVQLPASPPHQLDGVIIFGATGGLFANAASLADYLNKAWAPVVERVAACR